MVADLGNGKHVATLLWHVAVRIEHRPITAQPATTVGYILTNSHPFIERRANSSSIRARLLVMMLTLCPQLTYAALVLRIAAGSDVDRGVPVFFDQADDSSCCLLDSIQRGHQ